MKSPVGTINTYRIDENIRIDGEGSCRLQGDANLVRTRKGVLVIVSFRAQVPVVCSRCLTEFEAPLALDMREEFLPGSTTRAPLAPDEETFTITEREELDLGEAMRQWVLLSLPLRPLCHPYCAGLCPQCGSNLNRGTCTCSLQEARN